jgi:hypothetical protein
MWKSTLFIKRGVALFTTIAQYEGRKPSKEMDEEIPHLSSHLLSDTQTKGCTELEFLKSLWGLGTEED